ncbi:RNA-binding domain-containing protein [Suhomyces tanzawaensis NRRL Y-17324]|uniref:RNA-binding domain-containing protein n=1 Tax=Suhomyces tanzawaensis NRRL Y-17324 TaxID=984487 RepID=A0A1E4SC29_9ASCO|nr:RNA-binding domain-containing protein [Suhomyces tanzawaensis NRRL Y-17324]ODV77059.1 RNA-binding domain-containing protein [Suhomyces tanzawaensis NRRL Y-17324]
MSTFDDDEALFEDIYADEPEAPSKPEVNEAVVKDDVPETKDTSAPEDTQNTPNTHEETPAQSHPETQPEGENSQQQNQPPQDAQYGQPQGQSQYGAPPPAPSHGGQAMPQFPGQPQFGQGFQQTPPPPPPVVHQPSNIGKESGKMFIGGLNWDTSEEGLVSYFSKYGEVLDYTIMRDNNTGKSRGFGFLTFKDPKSVDEVIKTDHILDGKLIDPKRAIAREEQDKVGKIFVGGIDPMVNEKEFNDFFSQFGSIIDAQLMIDKDTGRSRGFGFITYDSPDAVDRVTVNKYLTLKGKAMEVKRAEPRGQHQQNQAPPPPQTNQYNNYAAAYNPYGQGQYPQQQQQMAAYGQAMNMTPEMMQEYWQRMQQWYMYQQQVAQGQQPGAIDGAEGQDQQEQPLNPQQQASEERNDYGNQPRGDSIHESRQSNFPRPPSGPSGNGNQRGNARDGYDNPHRDGRRNNLPKGPRRAPPSGPSGGNGNGNGNGNRRHRRGGRDRGDRGYHPYSRGGGGGGRRDRQ